MSGRPNDESGLVRDAAGGTQEATRDVLVSGETPDPDPARPRSASVSPLPALAQPTRRSVFQPNHQEFPVNIPTPACEIYLAKQRETMHFAGLAVCLGGLVPFLKRSDRTHREQQNELERKLFQLLRSLARSRSPFATNLDLYEHLVLESLLCRSVDNLCAYVIDILIDVFRENPNLIPEKTTEPKAEAARERAAIDYADRVSGNGGLRDLIRALKRIAVEPDFDMKRYESALVATLVRNAIVHNRGRVNGRFLKNLELLENLKRIDLQDLKKGETIPFTREDVKRWADDLESVAGAIDQAIVRRYSLRTFQRNQASSAGSEKSRNGKVQDPRVHREN